MSTLFNLIPLAGRIALSAIFLSSGFAKLSAFSGTVGYIASVGLPAPEVTLALGIGVELLAGLALLLGYQARFAALALAGFSIVAGVLFHAYWADTDPQLAYVNQIMFWKNVAMAGGLLYVVHFGAGAFALDNMIGRGRRPEAVTA